MLSWELAIIEWHLVYQNVSLFEFIKMFATLVQLYSSIFLFVSLMQQRLLWCVLTYRCSQRMISQIHFWCLILENSLFRTEPDCMTKWWVQSLLLHSPIICMSKWQCGIMCVDRSSISFLLFCFGNDNRNSTIWAV